MSGTAFARDLLSRYQGRKVAVLGDLMLDKYIHGSVDRISPEAPVPVVEVRSHRFLPGGAANACRNLHSLGVQPFLVGCVGRDKTGERLLELLKEYRTNTYRIVRDPSRPTTVKTRVVANNQQVIRMDRESRDPIGEDIEQELVRALRELSAECEALLISDYAKGVVTPRLAKQAVSVFRGAAKPVVVDSKSHNFDSFAGATVIAPNIHEAERASGVAIVDEASLLRAGRALLSALGVGAVLITRGSHGMSLFEDKQVAHIPAVHMDVFDVTGAGDTVAAGITAALCARATYLEAALVANAAAAVVVRKAGAAAAGVEEILEVLNEWEADHVVEDCVG